MLLALTKALPAPAKKRLTSCLANAGAKKAPWPDKLSKEDAQRMLDALNNNEKQTQEKLKNKKFKGAKIPVTKDW